MAEKYTRKDIIEILKKHGCEQPPLKEVGASENEVQFTRLS